MNFTCIEWQRSLEGRVRPGSKKRQLEPPSLALVASPTRARRLMTTRWTMQSKNFLKKSFKIKKFKFYFAF